MHFTTHFCTVDDMIEKLDCAQGDTDHLSGGFSCMK